MTPKQKANELVDRFCEFVIIDVETKQEDYKRTMYCDEAKQCASICCDEIISELKKVGLSITNEDGQTPEEYFDEVKQEIEKL